MEPTAQEEDKVLQIKRIVKKRKLITINNIPINLDSLKSIIDALIDFIDKKSLKRIDRLYNKIINNDINNNKDIIFEIYNYKYLTVVRLKFLMKYCTRYFEVSTHLIKQLIKDKMFQLLNVIFSNLKFYDNDFIIQLLNYYRNKEEVSIIDLNQQISNIKYKILINRKYIYDNISIYLSNECKKININIYIIKYLIDLGADINKIDKDGETPLFKACKRGNITAVKYLVKHGEDINKVNKYKETPLFIACEYGNEAGVKYLVEHGADINKENKYKETPLFNACKSESESIVKYLVEHGANINKENKNNETPLFSACKSGNKAIVKYLVDHGVNINISSGSETSLFDARKNGNEAIVKYLIEHVGSINKETPVFDAFSSGNKAIIKY